jgi:hypothetical protein
LTPIPSCGKLAEKGDFVNTGGTRMPEVTYELPFFFAAAKRMLPFVFRKTFSATTR